MGALSGLDAAAKAPIIRAALLVRGLGAETTSPSPFEGAAAESMRPLILLAFIECRTE